MKGTNKYDSRDLWLKAATDLLRPHFDGCGYPLPDKIRFAVAFPSTGRKSKRVGELWYSSTSADEHFELIIRADLDKPADVLAVLVHELVHAVVPADAGHGKIYREAALKLGLVGKMREAMPAPLLQAKLREVAEAVGPLPHARLNIERGRDDKGPADRPKKQGTRLLKATCEEPGCGYTVRITAKWIEEVGPPVCPRHITAMGVQQQAAETEAADPPETTTEAFKQSVDNPAARAESA